MKKILKPEQREEALFYSDFTGKPLGNMGYEPVSVKITCNYGSKFDGSEVSFHLDDEDLLELIGFLKTKVSEDFKNEIKNSMKKLDKDHEDCFQARDWQSVEYIQNNMDLLKLLL
jgi:hypothetical protein